MENIKYISYKDYFKKRNIRNVDVFIGKTNKSYLIGPKVNQNFDEMSFYKRMLSSSVYDTKVYKRIIKRKSMQLIRKYYKELGDNEVIEILKNNNIIIHSIIPLPRGQYEKK